MRHKQRWTLQKIKQRLALIQPQVYRRRVPLPPFRYRELADAAQPPPVAPDVDDSGWTRLEPDSHWGRWRTNFVLRTRFTLPSDWSDEPVALFLPLGESGDFGHPEALVYLDGAAYAACDRFHQEILLPPGLRDGRSHTLAIHGWTGLGGMFGDKPDTGLWLQPCYLVQIDAPTQAFIATARVALGVAENLNDNEPASGRLLNGLDAAFQALDTREPIDGRFYRTIPQAHTLLKDEIARAGPPLDVHIHAVGHAHLDVAWLWTLAQARQKAARSFHTVIRLMEQFPEYDFTQSQPQLYEFVRQDHPDLFAAIQEQVKNGRWEPVGGMWVEADCNLSGAESLARQLLLGRTFFREQFGPQAESPILWLPDVFGYAWNLPQLIKQAGLDYFFTIKIGWSQYNRMPYDSFWWQGLDGTRVLTHYSPTPESGSAYASTYNAQATPQDTLGTWRNYQQKEITQDVLMAFGHGDGGGGPTRAMLENIREMSHFPATPQMRHSRAIDFFRRLEATAGSDLPVWKGELYLEYHRGTYTTQARNKRANRKAEFLLHDAEFLAMAAVLSNHLPITDHQTLITDYRLPVTDYDYPQEKLKRAWRLLCLNQFHDIIPGSSIQEVYEESLAQYAEITALATAVRDEALTHLANLTGGDWLIVNPTPCTRRDLVYLAAEALPAGSVENWAASPEKSARLQRIENGVLLDVGELSPYAITAVSDDYLHQSITPAPMTVSPTLMQNAFLRVELNEAGDIIRLTDRQNGRDLLPTGMVANQFQAFEDRPLNWDAWDIDIFYDDKMWPAEPATSVQVVETGPLRIGLEIRRRILNSDVTQRLYLTHNNPRLDFHTKIVWRERHILLKVAFPVDLLAPTATYEIQWGHVERPTHRNTSWDWARFETCAHKWVDVSEGDYGVSLLNDCKYGHDVQDSAPQGTLMRLTLLRSPTLPDHEADQGEHEFTYSLLPHNGRLGSETIAQAYALNDPILIWPASAGEPGKKTTAVRLQPFIAVNRPNVLIETIKQAEDGRGLIVRLYESQRQRGPVTLTCAFPLQAAWRTNLLEEDEAELEIQGNEVRLAVRPFQIITLRLLPQTADDSNGENEECAQSDQPTFDGFDTAQR